MKKVIASLVLLTLFSCGTSTTIVSSWRDPETVAGKEPFKKILAVALLQNESTRRQTENRLSSIDPSRIFASYNLLNGAKLDLTEEQKVKILKDENYDGVITMRLVDVQKETNYVPGTSNYGTYYGGGYYGNSMYYGGAFYGWYGAYYPSYYESTPGYYEETTYFLVETNIFSLTKNRLIWTGTSKSANINDIGTTIDEIITEVINEMRRDGTLPKK